MSEHKHTHDESCGCGHDHTHDESCGCGHDHAHDESCGCGHDHAHDESCGCGHDHAHDESCGCGHDHAHDESCGCGHDHSAQSGCGGCAAAQDEVGVIRIEHRMHDEAVVVSGTLTVVSEYAVVRYVLERQLAAIARAVTARGGIIGHIKAAAAATETEMFSITDEDVTVKKSPEQTIHINLASIVFAISPETVEQLVEDALTKVLENS